MGQGDGRTMSYGGTIIALYCLDCGKACSPSQVVRIGESVIQCWNCYDAQRKVIESWAEPPTECALCHTKFAELALQVPGRPVSMFPHWIDGTLGLLCVSCDQIYVLKQLGQFKGTRFGRDLKV